MKEIFKAPVGPYEHKGKDRREKTTPRSWRMPHLEKFPKDSIERKEAEKRLAYLLSRISFVIASRAEELEGTYRDVSGKDSPDKKSFHDERFFFKRAYDDFSELVVDEPEEIIKYLEGKDVSNTIKRKIEGAIGHKKKACEKLLETVIPGFTEFKKGEKLDLLDDMYEQCWQQKDSLSKYNLSSNDKELADFDYSIGLKNKEYETEK